MVAEVSRANIHPSWIKFVDLDPSAEMKLQKIAKDCARSEWWTWAEALAWLFRSDYRDVASIRFLEDFWPQKNDTAFIPGTQYQLAKIYCGSDASKLEQELCRLIEDGKIKTIGRRNPSSEASAISASKWRGGRIHFTRGTAQLVSRDDAQVVWAHDIAVHRQSMASAFQHLLGGTAKNRQLDHDEIRRKASEMRAQTPNISRGSAAASIVEELPHNPRTKKPRDQRNIERIIATLWEGGNNTSLP